MLVNPVYETFCYFVLFIYLPIYLFFNWLTMQVQFLKLEFGILFDHNVFQMNIDISEIK